LQNIHVGWQIRKTLDKVFNLWLNHFSFQKSVVNNEDAKPQSNFSGIFSFHLVAMLENIFPSSLMTRPNKLEGLSLETLSSQVLEFEGKARANPIGAPSKCFLLG
jgi:hypothetical protein